MRHWWLVLCVFILSLKGYSQRSDAKVWLTGKINFDLTEKLRFSLEEEFRFYENVSKTEKYHTEAALSYELGKRFGIGAGYRYENEIKYDGLHSLRHRFIFDLEYELPLGRIDLKYRGRYQVKYTDPYRSSSGTIPDNYMRNAISLDWNIKGSKFDPFMALEVYTPLNDLNYLYIDAYRVTAGITIKINDNRRLEIYERYDQELMKANPLTSYITGISYVLYIR